jgi:endoglucanase
MKLVDAMMIARKRTLWRSLLAAAWLTAALIAGAGHATDTSAAGGGPALAPFVSVSGSQMVLPDGRPLRTNCINLGNWLVPEGYMFRFRRAESPRAIHAGIERLLGATDAVRFWELFRERYVAQADVELIKRLGFNTIRVPFHYALFTTDGRSLARDGEGFALLDRLVAWSRAAGLLVIFDMHAAPGGQTGANHDDAYGTPLLYYVPAYQDLTVDIWRAIAERYKDEPAVLGYNLLNEPIAHFHDYRRLNPKLVSLYKRIITSIRQVDRNHLIFLDGTEWSTNFGIFDERLDPKAVYVYHRFWSKAERAEIQQYLNFRSLYDVPIWLGETGEATDAWIKSFRELHEAYDIGWCFWTYKNLETTSTVVSVARPPDWDAVVALVDGGTVSDDSPARAKAVRALATYLDNIKLENATVNDGYVRALGLGNSAVLAAPSPGSSRQDVVRPARK